MSNCITKRPTDKITNEFRDRLKEKMESNAEYQRRKAMTKDEKLIDARNRMAKNLHEFNQHKKALPAFAEAEAKANEILQRHVSGNNKG